MDKQATFFLTYDGQQVEAQAGETLWQLAQRLGDAIPHLCFSEAPGYRADGNCRACMVEIEGERTLVASCMREASAGLVIWSQGSQRAQAARKTILEMLAAEQPARAESPDRSSHFWHWAEELAIDVGKFPRQKKQVVADRSHPAMQFAADACIQCGLCVRACREVQVNDVIGLVGRGQQTQVVFDLYDPMGESHCVGCGECVQICPTGALMPKTLVDAQGVGDSAAFDRSVDSVCPYCGVGCQVSYKVREDRIIAVEGRNGPANAQRLCVKGRFGADYVHHAQRLLTPLIRREGVSKQLDPNFDPAQPWTHFRPATWEEALDKAASGFAHLRAAYGAQALAGLGSAKCSNEEAWLFQKLIRTGFGSNHVDHCTRLCHASSVAALLEGLGSGAVTASFRQAEQSDVILLTGCNPAVNHPVAATFFKQAAKRGAKLIIIDPRGQALSEYADEVLRFKPGSDVALYSALLHVIINEGLYNAEYIAAHTEGFEAFKTSVAQATPEAMAPICGIEPERLRKVARLYAQAASAIIFWGMGISQHTHGTDNARCLIALALACGQTGRPGTGLHPLRGQNNVQGASDAGLIPMFLPDYQSVADAQARAKFERLWSTPLPSQPGLTVVEMIHAMEAGQLRGMYIMGENPAMSDPDLAHSREALARLEHLVVQDLFITETAQLADVILPASAWIEKEGTVTNTNRQVQLGQAALPLPGEAKPDWWIIQALAQRMGLPWEYSHPREVFAEMQQGMASLSHISWQRLQQESAVTYPCASPDQPGQDIVFADAFPRAGGRAAFHAVSYQPPAELPDQDYPLILTTGRVLEHWHTGSMTRRSQVLDALEPEARAHLAPTTLQQLGLPGDAWVSIRTRRGEIQLRVRADSSVAPGQVFLPFCYQEAAANLLTNPALDPYGKIPEFKFAACRLEAIAEVPAI
ncbi:formate dehydrogenase subunit alpha [Nitrincola tapanii]|uniref:formate dehydrogenase subunit alpha n=1 Tax=Nitrincola tapanii TaxID=1708751 RepID=UPI00190F9544|nr:formate dehydrogenase subunit alpha [Nitrincola tapanii]